MASEGRLSEDDLWGGAPLQAAPRLLDELLEGAPGLRLWAPTVVALDRRAALPVFAGVRAEAAELARLAFADRAVLVAVDTTTGQARVALAARNGPRDASSRLAAPPGFEGGLGPTSGAAAGEVVRLVAWDASTGAQPWSPGRHRLAVIAADRISDDVAVEVARSTTTVDPAVRDVTPESAAGVWPPPDPSGGLPRYDAGAGAPAPPAEPGVVLACERVVNAREGAACVLRGSVRAHFRDSFRARHGALIPVTLVVTGTEVPGPFVVSMRIPSFDRDAAAAGGAVTARFAIDLFRLAPAMATRQTYFVYAFTADGRAGPQPVAVVAP